VRPHDKAIDQGHFYVADEIVKVCAGLVVQDSESNIIRHVHYTMHDYFERYQRAWMKGADADITAICLTYLSMDSFSRRHLQ
jgi:hypothetical protein